VTLLQQCGDRDGSISIRVSCLRGPSLHPRQADATPRSGGTPTPLARRLASNSLERQGELTRLTRNGTTPVGSGERTLAQTSTMAPSLGIEAEPPLTSRKHCKQFTVERLTLARATA
jgi:hypothetical protein